MLAKCSQRLGSLVLILVAVLVGGVPARGQDQFISVYSRGSEDCFVRERLAGRGIGGRAVNGRTGDKGLQIGDDTYDRSFRSILSFDTASIPDSATITGAILEISRGATIGSAPSSAFGPILVDVQPGFFGTSPSLEAVDFHASSAQVQSVSIRLGQRHRRRVRMSSSQNTLSYQIPLATLNSISKTGRTQFRMRFQTPTNQDGRNNILGFYSGESSDPTFRPRLIVSYTAAVEPTPQPIATATGTAQPTPTPIATTPPAPGSVLNLLPGTSWQWQLQGTIDTSFNVKMYDIDLFDAPTTTIQQLKASGRVVICYFSAGSYEDWRPDASKFPASVLGRTNGWPGERWLDIRRLDTLGPIMSARLDLAKEKGCDGVEPDNVDGYVNNTGFPLTGADQLAFNRWLAETAHARGLSVGLKNDLDQVKDLVDYFDWALNEQCFQYNECEMLLPFVQKNKAVFGVEYQGDPATFCPTANSMNFDWLKKNLSLDASRIACR